MVLDFLRLRIKSSLNIKLPPGAIIFPVVSRVLIASSSILMNSSSPNSSTRDWMDFPPVFSERYLSRSIKS